MKEAKELFEAITPIRNQIANRCQAYLKKVLKKAENHTISFFDNEGEAIDNDYVSVIYDGGRHPEYASNAFSNVNAVFLNSKGRICLDIEDCDEYEIDNVSWDELYTIAEFVYEHALPYWRNA